MKLSITEIRAYILGPSHTEKCMLCEERATNALRFVAEEITDGVLETFLCRAHFEAAEKETFKLPGSTVIEMAESMAARRNPGAPTESLN